MILLVINNTTFVTVVNALTNYIHVSGFRAVEMLL